MRFEFATAGRIVFGPGTLAEAGPIAREFGHHALVVTGRDPRALGDLEALGGKDFVNQIVDQFVSDAANVRSNAWCAAVPCAYRLP